MKILINGDYLDFESPMHMEEDQFNEFVNFIEHQLNEEVIVKNIIEKHKTINDVERNPREWTSKELFLLLSPISNEELVEKLGRSDMSIVMKRGSFVPGFMSWARKKGYDSSKITETIIKQFLEEGK